MCLKNTINRTICCSLNSMSNDCTASPSYLRPTCILSLSEPLPLLYSSSELAIDMFGSLPAEPKQHSQKSSIIIIIVIKLLLLLLLFLAIINF